MIAIPKGTKDVLPEESYKWHYIEEKIRSITALFSFKEIRTPVFEHTELFLRGVGDSTDIVNKEMYTFMDKGERSMTLKPEGTAGVARSFAENGMQSKPLPAKMYYITPVFRYEKPQSGRLREHHQFGAELYGSFSPYADIEVITLAKALLNSVGIADLKLNINSIGCDDCRHNYSEALKNYFAEYKDKLCPTCLERLQKNPLRLLDCKVPSCGEIAKNAPIVLDYICQDCTSHHNAVLSALTELKIPFEVNPRIVRGLDYYTRTVFEFISTSIGSQGTVCGGGRYNNLLKEIGGSPVPAVGFGMGIERLIMVMESANLPFGEDIRPVVYIAPLTDIQVSECIKLTDSLRKIGISADTDITGRSLKAQMKYADKMGYNYVIVIGDEELKSGKVVLKDMLNKQNREVKLENFNEWGI